MVPPGSPLICGARPGRPAGPARPAPWRPGPARAAFELNSPPSCGGGGLPLTVWTAGTPGLPGGLSGPARARTPVRQLQVPLRPLRAARGPAGQAQPGARPVRGLPPARRVTGPAASICSASATVPASPAGSPARSGGTAAGSGPGRRPRAGCPRARRPARPRGRVPEPGRVDEASTRSRSAISGAARLAARAESCSRSRGTVAMSSSRPR